jgi:sRNA-binding regulator protein Hfq
MFLLVRTVVFDSPQKNKNLFTVFLLEGRKKYFQISSFAKGYFIMLCQEEFKLLCQCIIS